MKTDPLLVMSAALALAIWGACCSGAPVPVVDTEPKELASLSGHTDTVVGLAFSYDSKLLVSAGGRDRTTRVWDIAHRKHLATFELSSDDTELLKRMSVGTVAFNSDGKTVAVGGGCPMQLWDIDNGQKMKTVQDARFTWNLVSSPNGKTFVWGDTDICVFDLEKQEISTPFKEIGPQLKDSREVIFGLAYTAKGELLFTTFNARQSPMRFALWNADTGKKIVSIEANKSILKWLALSPDGKALASVAQDNKLRLWDTATGNNTFTIDAHLMDSGLGEFGPQLAFSPDGKLLAAPDRDQRAGHSVHVYEVATGKELAQLKGYTSWAISVVFSPDGKLLATGTRDGKIKLWSIPEQWKPEK